MSLCYGTAYGYYMLEMVGSPCISSSTSFSGDITFPINQPGNNTYSGKTKLSFSTIKYY